MSTAPPAQKDLLLNIMYTSIHYFFISVACTNLVDLALNSLRLDERARVLKTFVDVLQRARVLAQVVVVLGEEEPRVQFRGWIFDWRQVIICHKHTTLCYAVP